MMGGGQEGGCRSGTENMAGIAALGAVLAALERGDTFLSHGAMAALRDRLALALRDALPGVVFNTPFEHALPTTLNFSVPGLASRDLLELFDAAGLRVSSGSACSSAKAAPSHVLEAMGLPCWRSASAVRLSFGPATDPALIDAACDRLLRCGEVLRARAAAAELPAVTQVSADGVSAWIVADARARQCVVIDRAPALAERIDAVVRGYTVRAELATCAAASWPEQHELVALANRAAPALMLGGLALVRWAAGGSVAYLAGRAPDAGLAAGDVDFVFVRRAADAGVLAGVADEHAVVCCAADEHSVPFTTVGAEAGGRTRVPAMDGLMHVAPPALERFLETHPGAIVVDVREPHERMAGPPPAWRGADTLHVPMSQLASWLPQWLRSGQPALVFFCRSGNRSARAALMLHRLGYRNAWSLSGGLALNTALAA
jgi:rhodanese-related sulfurtransferase